MARAEIYKELLDSQICQFVDNGAASPKATINFPKILSNADLNIRMLEYIGQRLDTLLAGIDYTRVLASYSDSYQYAVDIAVSNKKRLMFPSIVAGVDGEQHVTFPDIFDIDESVVLVVGMLTQNNYENCIKLINTIRQYGGKVVAVVEVFSLNYGYEFAIESSFKKAIKCVSVFNVNDIADYGDVNGIIDMFYFEKYKFAMEVSIKRIVAEYADK